jgi:site-specific recombinase XerD
MVHVKIHLDTRRIKSDGTFNIIFRITQFKKVYTISSGISVGQKHWNSQKLEVAKTHPHSQQLNLRLSKQYFEIQRAVLALEDEFSIEALQEKLGGKVKPKVMSFKLFAESLITQMYAVNRAGNAIVYQTAVNRFLDFCAKPTIQFKEITYTLLDQFAHHLALEGLRQNSIANYFRSLRAIYNKAIKAKVIDRSAYPFLDLKIKSEKTTKRAVLRKDISSLEQLDLSADKAFEKALKCFLLSFYLIGLSFTDLAYLTKKNIQDGRVVYRRRKTHKNYSIKLYPKAEAILNELYQEGNKYLLPILPNDVIEDSLKAKQLIHQWIKTTNKYLKRLGKEVRIEAPLTTYVARHTFATTAKKLGYSNELIAEALGHEYGNKITNIYLDSFDKEIVDEMHGRVIS